MDMINITATWDIVIRATRYSQRTLWPRVMVRTVLSVFFVTVRNAVRYHAVYPVQLAASARWNGCMVCIAVCQLYQFYMKHTALWLL